MRDLGNNSAGGGVSTEGETHCERQREGLLQRLVDRGPAQVSRRSCHKLYESRINLGFVQHTDTCKLLLTGCTQKAEKAGVLPTPFQA